MVGVIDARTVKHWLSDGREIAFIDVREHGEYGEGHPFFSISVPFSRFEPEIVRLVPNINARLVLMDGGDGVAERAAQAAEMLGYRRVSILDGGADGWQAAGYTLFAGVNVPSKTFGEMLEHARHTPRITAAELARLQSAGDDLVVVDGRPFSEYQRMNIPGGICCPNGELALRIDEIAPSPATLIVVNCAGRTRSILGAETLIALGVPNAVAALENGTQGWFLEGLELERGAGRLYDPVVPVPQPAAARSAHARALAAARGVKFVRPADVNLWLGEADRTTFLLDVRTPEEFAAGSAPGFQHAPGGQLVQATDQWVGVRHARVVLADSDGVRAPMMAQWLAQLGHDVAVLEGGIKAAADEVTRSASSAPRWSISAQPTITAAELAAAKSHGHIVIVDVRASMDFRQAHIPGAIWAIRSRFERLAKSIAGRHVALVADRADVAALAAGDLRDLGAREVRLLDGGISAWRSEGHPIVATPDDPPDGDCIDFLFFVHDRHDGNAEAARGYIAWEQGLVDQLDADERAVFRLAVE